MIAMKMGLEFTDPFLKSRDPVLPGACGFYWEDKLYDSFSIKLTVEIITHCGTSAIHHPASPDEPLDLSRHSDDFSHTAWHCR